MGKIEVNGFGGLMPTSCPECGNEEPAMECNRCGGCEICCLCVGGDDDTDGSEGNAA